MNNCKLRIKINQLFVTFFPKRESKLYKYSVLSKGIFLISIGIGIAIARVLTLEFEVLNDFSTYLIALLLSGGIGLILYYKIIKKENHL